MRFILFFALLICSPQLSAQLIDLELEEFEVSYSYSHSHRNYSLEYKTLISESELDALPDEVYYDYFNTKTRKFLFYRPEEISKNSIKEGDFTRASGSNASLFAD